jgi:hypothetical protein
LKPVRAIIASPLLCLGLLAGITAEKRTHLKAADAEPYHARAKAAINAMPWNLYVNDVLWTAREQKPEDAAVRLLKPNEILSRYYTETKTTASAGTASVLIVQCRDSRDMTGHYPPICYPNSGHEMVYRQVREPVVVGEGSARVSVPFTEYHFEKEIRGGRTGFCVYNFFVVPNVGIVPDIKGVNDAAEDYQRRFFGAAQFQVVMKADVEMPRATRDEIFRALIGANAAAIETLKSVGIP